MKPIKQRLLTPGPTVVPERVLEALGKSTLYHRSPKFKEIFLEARKRLKKLFRTEGEVLILTSSGTGAMEAAVTNLFNPGDSAVVVVGGKFGERWKELCETFGVKPIVIEVEWGKSVRLEDIEEALKANSDVKGVLVQICETSTGTIHDVKGIGDLLKNYPDVLLIADGITAYGVYDIPTDEWGIDVGITGSQKALMTPPGLAIISLNEKAQKRLLEVETRSYYFDLKKELKKQQSGQTAYTAGVNLVVALNEALKMIEEEGLENVAKRHERLAQATRAGVRALGLELLSENPANGVTAVLSPKGINGQDIVKIAREKYGITIAGGQEHLKGKIFRLSHMGYVDIFDILTGLEVVEFALYELGYRNFKFGDSVSAAMETYQNL
ncbi:Serine--glyoxylate transaminase [Desulfurobacterium thermolithotrophum DSM 11699]|uniref:Serine--glyoxylate transaminase n=1 Tax=Desulfurobacterium thermolithotrophum (strain DSM 11699 / BSA) TaxID=868864 RepID=F0S0V2_DESTD|nr:alanine--glyoxylate aminotransferase family protein [Desulfurobacterium thermolithotrophum]ADY72756.1 Serine--glyoxylate transaminase [Desulfurobacterium thermolithotrophum DSM 11699]